MDYDLTRYDHRLRKQISELPEGAERARLEALLAEELAELSSMVCPPATFGPRCYHGLPRP